MTVPFPPEEHDPLSDNVTFTVSQLTRLIKDALEISFPTLWVEGEISGFRPSASGHCYFTLKDSSAQLSAVMFRREVTRLPFVPANGMHVLVRGRISVYEARGVYQIIADDIEPRGIGAIREALEKLRQKLDAEGLFAEDRKRPVPPYPQVVGVVTSATGAAFADILEVLREKDAPVHVILSPALVQGTEAAESIVGALDLLAEREDVDVVIIGRGGGSFEDLIPFSDERVVRAMADYPLPLVSAVGHEIDMTLADLAADIRAPTPSAAAEMVVRRLIEMEGTLGHLGGKLAACIGDRLETGRTRLGSLEAGLVHPRHLLDQGRIRMDDLSFRLTASLRTRLERGRSEMARLGGMLSTLGPPSVLRRGYAVVRKTDGTVVRNQAQVELGEGLDIRLAEGIIGAQVTGKDG